MPRTSSTSSRKSNTAKKASPKTAMRTRKNASRMPKVDIEENTFEIAYVQELFKNSSLFRILFLLLLFLLCVLLVVLLSGNQLSTFTRWLGAILGISSLSYFLWHYLRLKYGKQ